MTTHFEQRISEIRERLEAKDVEEPERDRLTAELNKLVVELAPPIRRSEMTLTQKSAFISEHGPDRYWELPA